ncbi:interleukin-8-like [Pristis pectinata]|uniref:interleukin-8-like n=1 Tax=Pristis pectinata TaxID=685728 RepID=UPI00223CE9FB|nr:interleukin-8-like [Pristis pectinata]
MFSKTSVTVLSVIVLCLVFTDALPRLSRRKRCKCIKPMDALRPNMKISNIKIFFKQPSCQNIEIIVNMENGKRVCLNPDAEVGRKMITSMRKKMIS